MQNILIVIVVIVIGVKDIDSYCYHNYPRVDCLICVTRLLKPWFYGYVSLVSKVGQEPLHPIAKYLRTKITWISCEDIYIHNFKTFKGFCFYILKHISIITLKMSNLTVLERRAGRLRINEYIPSLC